ncbi:MAG: histidyl-tRNA synthetase [Parcubacteria group bacterium Gr01-1014_3]|nr:MAG: histidyl-tRNA synthetase [Parcubacteria group bacterium Gr01-1014_3]
MSKKDQKKVKRQPVSSLKGMNDILPADQPWWDRIRKAVKEIAGFYNFLKIETPVMEKLELFKRPLGDTSDVVEKQMFSFKTKGGDEVVLRPEGTASIVRSYIEHGLSHLGQPLKLWYEGPMFRYEQPQAGRTRQFHQAGFEIISSDNDPVYDVQTMLACYRTLDDLKIKNINLQINSIGCNKCRPIYRKNLLEYYKNKEKSLCGDCKRRIHTNPMRLLDCKVSGCVELKKEAPQTIDNLCSDCRKHFKKVLEYLEELKLPYMLNPLLVRGFDYYTKTVFEIFAEGFDFALGAGGRYDYLIELMGGRQSPGVGGAMGLERIIEVMKTKEISLGNRVRPKIFLIHIGDTAKKRSLVLIEELREAGIDVMEQLGKDSLNAQLRTANKFEAPLSLIFGQKEAFEQSIIIRDMKTGAQETVPLKKIVAAIKRKMH